MVNMRMVTGVSVVVLLQLAAVGSMSLNMYKTCLYECLHCVETWGKDLFNGELCAEKCALTGGTSIDRTCTSFFTRSSRRVSASRQYLHSEDPSGRFHKSFSNGYSNGYLGQRGFRTRNYLASRGRPSSRSSVYQNCQRLCKTCELRYTPSTDGHSCLYRCVTTRKRVIAC